MQESFNKAFDFVKIKHSSQYHANKVSVSNHLYRVAKRLEYLLSIFKEGAESQREIIVVAALGHDLLEDTDVSKEEIKTVFGEKGFEIILGMTNEWGDKNVGPYVQKVSTSSEEVRLIKLSDLLDNITSVTYNIAALGKDWTYSYFLPIVTPMKEAMIQTEFIRFKQTGEYLKNSVEVAYEILEEELSLWK